MAMTRVSPRLATLGSIAAFVFLLVLSGCGGGGEAPRTDDGAQDSDRPPSLREGLAGAREGLAGAQEAMRGLQEAFGEAERDGAVVETVDFRRLRDLLPEAAAGLERTDASGERQSMGGFSLSNAQAEYRDDDRFIQITVTDAGGTGAFAILGAAWMMTQFDRESSDGYERTTTFDGFRAYEKYEERRDRGQLQFVVENRFFVSVEGRNVDMDDLRRAARQVDLRALAAMKNEGRAAS